MAQVSAVPSSIRSIQLSSHVRCLTQHGVIHRWLGSLRSQWLGWLKGNFNPTTNDGDFIIRSNSGLRPAGFERSNGSYAAMRTRLFLLKEKEELLQAPRWRRGDRQTSSLEPDSLDLTGKVATPLCFEVASYEKLFELLHIPCPLQVFILSYSRALRSCSRRRCHSEAIRGRGHLHAKVVASSGIERASKDEYPITHIWKHVFLCVYSCFLIPMLLC